MTDGGDTYQYAYNGLGQRVQQTVDSVVTDYLLDTQPALAQVLAATTGPNTSRYVHNPLGGMLAQHDAAGAWHWALVDGVGSVRGMVDEAFAVEGSRGFAPYGLPIDGAGSVTLPFAFTGEPRDGNGLQYHRARYYHPMAGVFPSLDPLEVGNRYAYVGGNVVNRVDPSGLIGEQPDEEVSCTYLVGSQPCHGIVGQTYKPDMDQWIIDQRFCTAQSTLGVVRQDYPRDYFINNNKSLISRRINRLYGISIANPSDWAMNDLAAVGRGIWLIARALGIASGAPNSGEALMQRTFGNWGTAVESQELGYCNLIPNAGPFACVPPPGLGFDGKTVYIPPGFGTSVFIHEMGHVFDFLMGTTYSLETLDNYNNPSTRLMLDTGGTYNGICEQIAHTLSTPVDAPLSVLDYLFETAGLTNRFGGGNANPMNQALGIPNTMIDQWRSSPPNQIWGACIASQMIDDYEEKGSTSIYGETNHFEDFAETWEAWVLSETRTLHLLAIDSDLLSSSRLSYMRNIVLRTTQ